jgi:hypothetical protein
MARLLHRLVDAVEQQATVFERAGPTAQAAGDGPDFIGNGNQYDPGDCCNDPRMFLKAAMAEDQRRSPS